MDNMQPHDSLADELDIVLPPDQSAISQGANDPLVDAAIRLASAPTLELSAEALARIELKIANTKPVRPRVQYITTFAAAAASLLVIFSLLTVIAQNAEPGSPLYVFRQLTRGVQVAVSNPTPSPEPSDTSLPPATATIIQIAPTIPYTETTEPTFARTSVSPTSTLPVTETFVSSPTNTSSPTFTETSVVATSTPVIEQTPTPTLTQAASVVITGVMVTPVEQRAQIIIEGPIEEIEQNTITIYGIRIQLREDDPLLEVLKVNDNIRIEGDIQDEGATFLVIAEVLTFDNPNPVDNEIYISPEGDDVWRDPSDCSNPPPAWAPANGWRARCEVQQQPNNSNPGNSGGNNNAGGNNNSSGNSNGNGNGNGGNNNGNGNGNSNGGNNNDDDDEGDDD
jgi:uncharacterized membrane protein YgcG